MAGSGPYNPMGGQPPGQMPPGMMPPGMPPQQMPPQHQMMPPRPIRRGTSKAVPVVVSAGLAVGVFCGLLFGLGTDRGEAAPPSKGNNVKKTTDTSGDVPDSLKPTTNPIPEKKAGSGSGSAVAAAGSGSGSGSDAAGSGSGSAVAAVAKPKLIIEITPDTVASGAHILVDGKEITGTSLEYEVDPATNKAKTPSVVVTVKAPGYKDGEQKVSLDGETTVKFEMVKGKTTLPKEVAGAGSGSGSATTAAAGTGSGSGTGSGATTATAKTGTGSTGTGTGSATTTAAKTGTSSTGTGTGSAKTGSTGTGNTGTGNTGTGNTGTHHTNTGTGSAKKPPGGLIDI